MTPNKERAIAALLTSKTKQEAAAAAGITDRTLRKYFEDRDFQEAYKEAFAGVLEDATRQAQQSAQAAISTLRNIVEDTTEASAVRVQAARNVLEYTLRLTNAIDIENRLRAMEMIIGGKHY